MKTKLLLPLMMLFIMGNTPEQKHENDSTDVEDSNVECSPPIDSILIEEANRYSMDMPRPMFSSMDEMLDYFDAEQLKKPLTKMIYSECGWDVKKVNPYTQSKGYIQIMPKTAVWLGLQEKWLDDELYQWDIISIYFGAQFKIVDCNIEIAKGWNLTGNEDLKDLYIKNFYPYAEKKSPDYILGSQHYNLNDTLESSILLDSLGFQSSYELYDTLKKLTVKVIYDGKPSQDSLSSLDTFMLKIAEYADQGLVTTQDAHKLRRMCKRAYVVTIIAFQNSPFDMNKDGVIRKKEFLEWVDLYRS